MASDVPALKGVNKLLMIKPGNWYNIPLCIVQAIEVLVEH